MRKSDYQYPRPDFSNKDRNRKAVNIETNNPVQLELYQLLFEEGFVHKIKCSEEEVKHFKLLLLKGEDLPPNVHCYFDRCYRFERTGFTDAEIDLFLKLKDSQNIKKIRDISVFFYVLTIISSVLGLIALIVVFSQ